MKKIATLFFAIGLMVSVNSCKKCGHCEYATGGNSSATCQNSTMSAIGINEYKQAEADCEANGDRWVVH